MKIYKLVFGDNSSGKMRYFTSYFSKEEEMNAFDAHAMKKGLRRIKKSKAPKAVYKKAVEAAAALSVWLD